MSAMYNKLVACTKPKAQVHRHKLGVEDSYAALAVFVRDPVKKITQKFSLDPSKISVHQFLFCFQSFAEIKLLIKSI